MAAFTLSSLQRFPGKYSFNIKSVLVFIFRGCYSSVMKPLFTCLFQVFSRFDHKHRQKPAYFSLLIFRQLNVGETAMLCVQPLSVRKNTACLQQRQFAIYCLGATCYCCLDILPVRATRWVQPLQTAPIFSCEKHCVSIFLGSARKMSLLTSCPCLLLPQTYKCPSSTTDREVKSV